MLFEHLPELIVSRILTERTHRGSALPHAVDIPVVLGFPGALFDHFVDVGLHGDEFSAEDREKGNRSGSNGHGNSSPAHSYCSDAD